MSKKLLNELISADTLQEVDSWIAKYPKDERQSAVMGALLAIQDEHNYLATEVLEAVADYLKMPNVAVYEVATFYTMYRLKPSPKHEINICTNISCKLRGCDTIVAALEEKLATKIGQDTSDNKFSLNSVECLGACVNAPVMQINKNYHENLAVAELDTLLEQYS